MQVTQEEVVNRQTVLRIELEDSDLDPYLERGYRRVVQRANIPGFRKGKAPRQIVEQYFGREGLLSDVLDYLASDVTARAIADRKLDATGLPKIELLELKPVTVKATVPLSPVVELGTYRAIRVPQPAVEVTDEDVSHRLEGIRQGMATWTPVDRPVQLGDLVTLDLAGVVDGQRWIDQRDALVVMDKDSERPIPGFAEAVAGAVKGQVKEFSLPIPKEHSDPRIAGKEALFTATVSEVKQKDLPTLDDEFAKGVGEGYESLAALREAVRKELAAEADRLAASTHREAALGALVEGAGISLPPLLVEHETEHLLADRKQALDRLNVHLDDYLRYSNTTTERLQEETRKSAVERLSRHFALSKLAELEGVTVLEEEVDRRLADMRAASEEMRSRGQKGRAVPDSTDAKETVRRALLIDKAIERLVAISNGETDGPGLASVETAASPAPVSPSTKGETLDSKT